MIAIVRKKSENQERSRAKIKRDFKRESTAHRGSIYAERRADCSESASAGRVGACGEFVFVENL